MAQIAVAVDEIDLNFKIQNGYIYFYFSSINQLVLGENCLNLNVLDFLMKIDFLQTKPSVNRTFFLVFLYIFIINYRFK